MHKLHIQCQCGEFILVVYDVARNGREVYDVAHKSICLACDRLVDHEAMTNAANEAANKKYLQLNRSPA